MNRLIETLNKVGKPPRLHERADGSSILVLPHGGRVLGLFARPSEENFLWTHPALESPESAAEFYDTQQWHNSGGDRTWLAPEVDFFFPNYPNKDGYRPPRELDPGNYQFVQDSRGERLVNRATCRLSRLNRPVEVEITKSFGPAPHPLRHERGLERLANLEYAGYTQWTSLKLPAGTDDGNAQVGLWNLLQMPHGGELLIATHVMTQPKIVFGAVDPDDLSVSDHLVRYRMQASGEQKIGIRAVAAAGRVGYRYPVPGGRWALVVRNVLVNPSGMYVDVPWDDPEDLGYAIQACNVNSRLGSFAELEYHVPAIGRGTGRLRCEDVSQVWAFRGSIQQIDLVASRLLSL